ARDPGLIFPHAAGEVVSPETRETILFGTHYDPVKLQELAEERGIRMELDPREQATVISARGKTYKVRFNPADPSDLTGSHLPPAAEGFTPFAGGNMKIMKKFYDDMVEPFLLNALALREGRDFDRFSMDILDMPMSGLRPGYNWPAIGNREVLDIFAE